MIGSVNKIFSKIFGNKFDRDLKELNPVVAQVHEAHEGIKGLSNDGLRAKTDELKGRIDAFVKEERDQIAELRKQTEGNDLNLDQKDEAYKKIDGLEDKITEKIEDVLLEMLPEAFAVVKETAIRFTNNEQIQVTATEMDRDMAARYQNVTIQGDQAYWANTWLAAGAEVTWAMVHYDVQLIGGLVLHQGKIAEMATGEGKTLVATLPVYLNALVGRGVHVVTVNNYLAKRDSEWMAPIFQFHGMSIDCIDNHDPNTAERRRAYNADITYGTNNEFGFDYLRDNMANSPEDLVQRPHHYAIVDEVDSVLVDDARTPLIISGPTPRGDQHEFVELKPRIESLVNAQRRLLNVLLADSKKMLNATEETTSDKKELERLHKEGGLALLRCYRGLPKNKALIKFLSEPGIRAVLQKTENYFLQDQAKEMPTVDAELFFVIDEKQNSIELMEKGVDLITNSGDDPSFFILPDISSELSSLDNSTLEGEALKEKKEQIISDYSVKAERVHTINQLLKAYTLFEKDVEYVLMDNKVKIVDEQTGRIMEGRRYSDGLHQAIEAKENAKIEAATQTYATVTLQNYFRMYNKLAGMTGTAETEAGEFWEIYKLDVVVIPTNRPIARDDRQDFVYKTVREKYNAVIEEVVQLTEAGRPVLVGTTSVEVSELLSRMLKIRKIKHNVLNAKMHQREAEVVAEAGHPSAVTIATNMAGRGTDIKLGAGVKESGGLAIIGTERHESRRVDRQLRGRAGRQGDPGSSQFFVSLEDNLMRLFGSERIAKLMDRLGLEEGEVIQHSMITKSIERAQKKVEENHFGVRKRLLEYDDVMNNQREVIYKRRRHALHGERMGVEIGNALQEVSNAIATEFQEYRDFDGFNEDLLRTLSVESPVSEEDFVQMSTDQIGEAVFEASQQQYAGKIEKITGMMYPALKAEVESKGGMTDEMSRAMIPVAFTDGKRGLRIPISMKEAYESECRSVMRSLERSLTLAMIDHHWKEHLRDMDDLRQSVQNAVYEQKDPLLIYKFESYELFQRMMNKVNREIVSFLVKTNLAATQAPSREPSLDRSKTDMSKIQASRPAEAQPAAQAQAQGQGGAPPQEEPAPKPQPIRTDPKVGRNDPCPCGSGKKFKHCHGKKTMA